MKPALALALVLLPATAWAQDWEKDWTKATTRAAAERRPILVVVGSTRMGTFKEADPLMKKRDVEQAAEPCIGARIDLDKGWQQPLSPILTKQVLWTGVIAVLSHDLQDGEVRNTAQLAQQAPREVGEWITSLVDTLGAPWETVGFQAEWRAKKEDRPLLVLFGSNADVLAPFRSRELDPLRARVVMLKVPGPNRRYPDAGTPGVALLDPWRLERIDGWAGRRSAAEVLKALSPHLDRWESGREARTETRSRELPFLCGSCGHRSAKGEMCCGLAMVEPEPPVWEKTWTDAVKRATDERRLLVYVLLPDARAFAGVQEVASEPRLAALSSRLVFYSEEVAEAGDRPGQLGVEPGAWVLLTVRDGQKPAMQAKAQRPVPDAARRLITNCVRRLRLAGSLP